MRLPTSCSWRRWSARLVARGRGWSQSWHTSSILPSLCLESDSAFSSKVQSPSSLFISSFFNSSMWKKTRCSCISWAQASLGRLPDKKCQDKKDLGWQIMFAYLTRRSRRVGLDLVQGHQGRFEPLWEYYLEDLEEYRISLFSFQNLIAHEGQGSIGGREGVGPWWADELLLIKVLRSKDRLISENWRFICKKSTNFGSGRVE